MKEYKYKINGNSYTVTIGEVEGNVADVQVNGVSYHVEMEESKAAAVKSVQAARPAAHRAEAAPKIAKPAAAPGAGTAVKAPLPGVVLSIPVKVGQAVKASDTVLVLEAMKMENAIHAGVDGTVKEVLVAAGDSVLEGNALIVIE